MYLSHYIVIAFRSDSHACSRSLALDGARLPFITHTCHHHYAQPRNFGLTWTPITLLITPFISVCSSVCSLCQHFHPVKDAGPVLFHVRCLLNLHSLYLLLVSSVDPHTDSNSIEETQKPFCASINLGRLSFGEYCHFGCYLCLLTQTH